MKSLHKLALPGNRQITGDFAQPGEKEQTCEHIFSLEKLLSVECRSVLASTYLWGGMQGTDTTGAAALLSARIFRALFILSLDFAFALLARSELQPFESSS